MSLGTYQKILSSICTNKSDRIAFLKDRKSFIENYTEKELSESTTKRLLALSSNQINEFATGLIRKRWGVVKSLLHIPNESLEILQKEFFSYAENKAVSGRVFKHQIDALLFAEYLFIEDKIQDEKLKSHIKTHMLAIQKYLQSEKEKQTKLSILSFRNRFRIKR